MRQIGRLEAETAARGFIGNYFDIVWPVNEPCRCFRSGDVEGDRWLSMPISWMVFLVCLVVGPPLHSVTFDLGFQSLDNKQNKRIVRYSAGIGIRILRDSRMGSREGGKREGAKARRRETRNSNIIRRFGGSSSDDQRGSVRRRSEELTRESGKSREKRKEVSGTAANDDGRRGTGCSRGCSECSIRHRIVEAKRSE